MTARERTKRSLSGRRPAAVPIMLAVAALVAVTAAGLDRSAHATEVDGARAGAVGEGAAAAAVGAPATDTITPAMIALGERVFQGRAGGAICTTCHGKDAKGLAGLGPDLTDGTWLHGDGSVKFLQDIIRTGVMQPKQGAAVMPPYGGVPLDAGQLAAVAAYVYSLSHQARTPGNGNP